VTQPATVTAAAGYDALSHAVESFVCTKRSAQSAEKALEAWRLLEPNYERVLSAPENLSARAAMQLGAFRAGEAIELSMLGATHACANPLTARYGTTHGLAIAILLPHVVRWNTRFADEMYAEMLSVSPRATHEPYATHALAMRLSELASMGELPRTLADIGASASDLPTLAKAAAEQWTGRFNPRPFDAAGALEIYECAY
jgi:alcohol dehydrogenase